MTTVSTVLIVEDDPPIRVVLEATLEDAGYQPVSVGDGNQAILALEADPARFRAVVSDIRLGRGPDDWEVARRARGLEPKMPVLYVSGDCAFEWSSRGAPKSLEGCVDHEHKPGADTRSPARGARARC